MVVSLAPEVKKQGGISLRPTNQDVPVETTEQRVERAQYALPTKDARQIQADFWLGHEKRLRDLTATQNELQMRRDRIALVEQMSTAAAQEGRDLTESEREFILSLSEQQADEPSVVLEKMYARRFVDELSQDDDPVFQEAEAEDPDRTREVRDASEDFMTKQQTALRILEDIQNKFDNLGFGNMALDFAKGVIPGYSWLKQRGRVETADDSLFLGENIQDQMRNLYLLPPEEFESELTRIVEEIAESNTLEAVNFANAAVEYSASDAAWDNVMTGLDALDVATLGGSAVIRYASKAQRAIRGSTQASSSVARQVSQGNVSGAAREATRNRLSRVVPSRTVNNEPARTRVDDQVDDLMNQMQGLLDAKVYFKNPGKMSNERARRLQEELSSNRDLLLSTMTDIPVINRLPEEALEAAFARAEQKFRTAYPNMEDMIIDVRPVREADDAYGGVDHIEILMGDKGAQPHRTQTSAQFYADRMLRLPEGGYDIIQDDGGWFVRVTKNIDETDSSVTDLRISADYQTPANLINTWTHLLSSADDRLARAHNEVRKVATYGGNAMMSRMAEVAQNIGRLGKNEGQRLNTILDKGRFQTRTVRMPDGSKQKVQGRFYNSQRELEEAYLNEFGSTPSYAESRAYFSFRQIMDFDYILRNVGMYRDKARLGLEQYSIGTHIPQADGSVRYGNSDFFEARLVDSLPSDSDGSFSVAWFDSNSGKPGFTVKDRAYSSQITALNNLLETGDYKILQVADSRDPALRDLFNTKGEGIDFVVVKNTKFKPLSSQQIPYNEGGHWMYPHVGNYIKQAQTHRTGFGRRIYDGDVTAHYLPTRAQGQQFVEAYETARRMLVDIKNSGGSRRALDKYIQANLPYRGVREFEKLFEADGPFNLDTPFVLTESGQGATDVQRLEDIFNEEIIDPGQSTHSLSSRIGTQFAQERNQRLTTINNTGTQGSPSYNLRPAPLLDPMETLARSSSMLAKSRFFDDYKHREIENWVHQFSDVLDMTKAEALANPVAVLRSPRFRQNVDHDMLAAAKSSRRSILQLMGTRTSTDNVLKWTKQKLADGIYGVLGETGVRVVEPILWNNRTDPITAARSLVFDAKLGFFNPVQFPLQASAASMAMAIDGNPIRSAQAVLLYWGMRSRGIAESSAKTQGFISKQVSKALGLSPDLVDEAYETWRRSGMHIIEGEYAVLDDFLNPQQFMGQSGISGALDAGRVFFKEGNNIHRGTAFSLAFLKWRQANPKARLTNKALAQITDRADLMYLRMSRASNAAWQSPDNWLAQIATLPTQFFGFQARLTQLMLGKQLTPWEKARLLGVNSLLWGVPVGAAGTAIGAVWPIAESIRQHALENGYSEEQASTVERILMNGILDIGIENIVGQDFNVAERFGPGGLDWAKSLMDGDLDEVIGAAPSFMIDTIGAAQPITQGVISIFNGETDYYQIGMTDVLDALKEISFVNNAHRAYMVYTAGEWLSKRDSEIADLPSEDPVLAIAAALNLTPQEVADTYIRMDSVTSHNEAQRATVDEALTNYERGLRAYRDGNPEQGLAFFKRARTLMDISGMTPLERQEVFREAIRDNETLMDQVNTQFWLQDPENRAAPEINTQEE